MNLPLLIFLAASFWFVGGDSVLFQYRYRHPLDPLSETEMRQTTRIINNYSRHNWTFLYIGLKEPAKSVLLPYFLQNRNPPRRANIPRRALTLLLNKDNNQAYEFTINLDRRIVEDWVAAPEGVNPMISGDEMLEAEEVMRKDPTVQRRCREAGWTNMSLVNGDPWSMGYIGDRPEYQGKRLVQMYMYAHPFDFLPIVDLLKKEVINIEELPIQEDFDPNNKRGNSVPRGEAQYDPALRGSNSFRRDVRPVRVTQRGTSFTHNGNEISWQKYKMRIGFNPREGLVIHNVNYNDNGTVRPLFYRMSLAEMFVPYGDPRPPYHRKHVIDEGQYGVGFNANPLRPQIDCLGEVHFLDAVVHNGKGEIVNIPKAVCIREEDAGILWKHTDFRTGKTAITRSQRLALTFIATIGNYDYIFSWNFYQDGSIEFNVKLTGILSTNMFAVDASPGEYGSTEAPQISGQYHQHFFSVRLDTEIDGNENSVTVSDVVTAGPAGSAQNPYGQGFTTDKKLLRTAGEARTSVAPEKSRVWLISNPGKTNQYTRQPVAFKLMPWATPPVLMQQESPIHPLVEWMDYNTWVTPYQEDQLFPGGYYLNNSGLPEWVGQNENANIDNTDIVLWHSFGLTHVPRIEDYPVMPAETCGIFLKPYNFFKENPALDVPPPSRRDPRQA